MIDNLLCQVSFTRTRRHLRKMAHTCTVDLSKFSKLMLCYLKEARDLNMTYHLGKESLQNMPTFTTIHLSQSVFTICFKKCFTCCFSLTVVFCSYTLNEEPSPARRKKMNQLISSCVATAVMAIIYLQWLR